jgi:hypothetical protein
MDRQTAIDRITETENLTDGLEDDDANWLLDWGIAHVDGLVTGIKDEDAAGEKLNQLMAVMRSLNQIAADRAAKPPDALAADIRAFLERYQQTFGAAKDATPTATSAPAADAKTAPTASQAPSSSTPAPAATAPASTPPATRAGADQLKQTPALVKPLTPRKKGKAQPTPATAGAATPATAPASAASSTNATPSAGATSDPSSNQPSDPSSDPSVEAAEKVATMAPRDAMQYLLSLAGSSSVAA